MSCRGLHSHKTHDTNSVYLVVRFRLATGRHLGDDRTHLDNVDFETGIYLQMSLRTSWEVFVVDDCFILDLGLYHPRPNDK
jgi:hypothetical protein